MPDVKVDFDARSKKVLANMVDADLMPILRKEMRKAVGPVAPAVRKEARALPSTRKGPANDSLRRAVANIIKVKIRINPREIMAAVIAVPKGGKSNLARVLEGEIPWWHPVFGHENSKVDQESHPFFYSAVARNIPEINHKMTGVLDKFEKEI